MMSKKFRFYTIISYIVAYFLVFVQSFCLATTDLNFDNLLVTYKEYYIALDYFSEKALKFQTHSTKEYIETYLSGNYIRIRLNNFEKEIKRYIYNHPSKSLESFINFINKDFENEPQNLVIFSDLINYAIKAYKNIASKSHKLDQNLMQKVNELEGLLNKYSLKDVKISHKINQSILNEINAFFDNASDKYEQQQIKEDTVQKNNKNANKTSSTTYNKQSKTNETNQNSDIINKNPMTPQILLKKIAHFILPNELSQISKERSLICDYNPTNLMFLVAVNDSNQAYYNDKNNNFEKIALKFRINDIFSNGSEIYFLDKLNKKISIINASNNFELIKEVLLPNNYKYEKILFANHEKMLMLTKENLIIIYHYSQNSIRKIINPNYKFVISQNGDLINIIIENNCISQLEFVDIDKNYISLKIPLLSENLLDVSFIYNHKNKIYIIAESRKDLIQYLYIYDVIYNKFSEKFEIITCDKTTKLIFKSVHKTDKLKIYAYGYSNNNLILCNAEIQN